MKKLLITGSAGLIGSESVKFFAQKGFEIYGIDNDMRAYFFGKEASTRWNLERIKDEVKNYMHFSIDIREKKKVEEIFEKNKFDFIIHTAAQPSHDWAAKEPLTDFGVNSVGTLILLECLRKYCPEAVFIYTSTNKVYGDRPNTLPLIELKTRYELPFNHRYYRGIDETMSIDDSKHSIFGVSKVAADVMVQEYGKYFDLKTCVFRGGCLTGPSHSSTKLHGFLAYLAKCIATGQKYTIFGYKGKQVRDNIHSYDLVNAFYHVYQNPRQGEVYNMGGSRHSNISMLEAIEKIEGVLGKKANYEYREENRIGDHIWYISDVSKFQKHYPKWEYQYDSDRIIEEICLSGHFSSASYASSTLTYFEGGLASRENLGKVFFSAHVTNAYGHVQALRLYLGSISKQVISVEHLLRKTYGRLYLIDFCLDFWWFYKNRKNVKLYFGINFLNALAGAVLKKLGYKYKLIYYSIDYSPRRSKSFIVNWVFHHMDTFCIKKADLVWNGSPEMVNLRHTQGLPDEKNILARSGVRSFPSKDDGSVKKINQKQILVIDGFLSNDSMAEIAIKSLSFLKKKFPEIKLKIFMGRLKKENLKELADKEKVATLVEFIEDISHQKAFLFYRCCGVGLGLFQVDALDTAAYKDPAEIKEFLAAGLPVLCSNEFQISEEIEREKIGLSVGSGPEEVAQKIDYLLSQPKIYSSFSKNAIRYAKNLSWEKIFNKALQDSNLI